MKNLHQNNDVKAGNVLELQDICKDYIQGRSVVEVTKSVNLSVAKGELIAIVGASGSGKSTLLHIAGLLDQSFTGAVRICGIDATRANSKTRDRLRLQNIGFIYQYHHLLKDFNACENVAMPRLIAGCDYEQSIDEADMLLEKLGLGKRGFNYPGEMSGGEQQRVAIARSMINNPKVILADEPTGNLDAHAADAAIDIFLELAKTRALSAIIVTHNNQLAAKMNKVYELKNGILRYLPS
jgi:lipoprotein-releasing system ATP-binding protein